MKRRVCLWAVIAALSATGFALAQEPRDSRGIAGLRQRALQDQNQEQPIQIEAATLEVRDKNKMATFSGDVEVTQGDTTIKCQKLVVFYGGGHVAGAGQPAAAARLAGKSQGAGLQKGKFLPQGAQDIRRIEARGGVTVVSKDQSASGDLGVYDLKKKTITLTGNVVVSQGQNVLHGDRVVVDTATGDAHMESGSTGQNRVRALILPGKDENGAPNVLSIGPNRPN